MNRTTTLPAGHRAGRPASRHVLALAVTTLLLVGATSCADDTTTEPSAVTGSAPTSVGTDTSAAMTTDTTTDSTTATTTTAADDSDVAESALTDDEVAGLLWMREEEQLAHDVYVVLGDMWGLRIFENIAASETSHVEAVSVLLDRYGIDDPADGNQPGTYTDPAIQTLYDQLVADGSRSLDAALAVGALIEELDISDLQTRTAATQTADIITVYANLERGSRNHLRAFVSELESRGVVYEPTQLDPAVFDAIVSSEIERGPDN
jgi:hypothetical protein